MNALIYFFVSGRAFLVGGAFLIFALMVGPLVGRRVRSAAWIIGFLGVVFVALSATPVTRSAYISLAVVAFYWLLATMAPRPGRTMLVNVMRFTLVTLIFLMCVLEWMQQSPNLFTSDYYPRLYVLGDSISAGLGASEKTWPQQLADRHQIIVSNLARVGATLDIAIKEANQIPAEPSLILIEIGGNDILRGRSPEQFRADLRRLLQIVCRKGSMIVMLELPLLPFDNAYGLAQRELAQEFQVTLIPKRYFAEILAYNTSVSGDLHLSPHSQEQMAEMIWNFIKPLPTPGQTLAPGS